MTRAAYTKLALHNSSVGILPYIRNFFLAKIKGQHAPYQSAGNSPPCFTVAHTFLLMPSGSVKTADRIAKSINEYINPPQKYSSQVVNKIINIDRIEEEIELKFDMDENRFLHSQPVIPTCVSGGDCSFTMLFLTNE